MLLEDVREDIRGSDGEASAQLAKRTRAAFHLRSASMGAQESRSTISVDEPHASSGVGSATSALSQVGTSAQVMAEIRSRLIVIEEDFREEFGQPLRTESVNGFLCFLEYTAVRMPILTADDTGRLIADWHRDDECLTLRFNDRYDVGFAMALESLGGLRRRWGTVTLSMLWDHGACSAARKLVA